MTATRHRGGLPLAVYVVALLLVPLVGVGVFASREIDRNNQADRAAGQISRAVEARSAAVAALAPLQIERMALLGMVRSDEFGLTDQLETRGLDFADIHDTNTERVDRALDRYSSALLANEVGLDAFERTRATLFEQRAAVRRGDGDADILHAAFDSIFGDLDSTITESRSVLADVEFGSLEAASLVRRLGLIDQVATTATAELAATSYAVIDGDPMTATEMMTPAILHVDALAAAVDVDVSAVSRLRAMHEVIDELGDPTSFAVLGLATSGDAVVDDTVEGLVARFDYLSQIAMFSSDEAGAVRLSVDAWAVDSGARNRTALLFFVAIGLASVLFGLIVMRSFTRPLTLLRAQAERISRGELHAEPLDLEGPSDVRKVIEAINDMASTLSLVDEHMQALAIAERGDGPVLQALPGRVGASMRTSMERVTALTSRLQISEVKLAEEARIDNLTGLPNRFAVLEYLESQIHRLPLPDPTGRPTSRGVMFVDVDGFKSVNDTHGHAVGDSVLREISRRLSGSIRGVDYIARLGGDEFLIVVNEISDAATLVDFGERMIREIEQPYAIGDQLFAVSASVGVTLVDVADDPMSAIERADAAVYQAKRRGRRRVEMFDKDLQCSIERQAELELALRQAIQHDELRIHLQPLADMTTGLCSGAEALVRWERPGHGLVHPGDFIPIAERSGLIFDLERWVLVAACKRIAGWRLRGLGDGMRLAVNISGRHLIEGDLLSDLDSALLVTGADPNLLEIELTESQLLDDVARASSVLAAVRARGVKVAIDDFGTGYSSMTYLQKLPVDVVKIDRSFISTATANEFDSTIVESVVTIANALSLDVVAEGIETFDQLAYSIGVGVTLGQGFLLARPMPESEAESVIFGPPLFDVERVRREAGLDPAPWNALPPVGRHVEIS